MKPLRRRSGNQHLHHESQKYRDGVKRKTHAYHVFMQAGVISQGLLQYLAAVAPTQVWNSFGSWLRTIRPGVAPSEFVVARRAATHAAGISPEYPRTGFHREIHR
jgi:hypothetical protein